MQLKFIAGLSSSNVGVEKRGNNSTTIIINNHRYACADQQIAIKFRMYINYLGGFADNSPTIVVVCAGNAVISAGFYDKSGEVIDIYTAEKYRGLSISAWVLRAIIRDFTGPITATIAPNDLEMYLSHGFRVKQHINSSEILMFRSDLDG